MQMRFLRDEPISKLEQDQLGLTAFMDLVQSSIRATETPFVFGILGDWGTGKTSAMQLLKVAISEDKTTSRRFVPVWFNAWLYENEQNLIYPLLHVIKQTHKELDIGGEQSRFRSFFRVAAATAVAASDLALRALTKKVFDEAISFEDVVKDTAVTEKEFKRLEGVMSAWADKVSELRGAFKDLIDAFAADFAASLHNKDEEDIVFLIMIDDLDRCLPGATLSILESIKNFLAVDKCIYVLGMNPAAVYAGIQHKYLGVNVSGREYLEKIVNYSFYIPEPGSEAIKQFALSRLTKLIDDEKTRDRFADKLAIFGEVLSDCHYSNPRKIKRVLNRYLVFLDRYEDRLEDYDMSNVVKLIIQSEYYPDLFQLNLTDAGQIEKLHKLGTKEFNLAEFERDTGLSLAGDYANLRRLSELFKLTNPMKPKADLGRHARDVFAIARLG